VFEFNCINLGTLLVVATSCFEVVGEELALLAGDADFFF